MKYDRDLLLHGAKRNQVRGLGEVRRYGTEPKPAASGSRNRSDA